LGIKRLHQLFYTVKLAFTRDVLSFAGQDSSISLGLTSCLWGELVASCHRW